MLLCTMRTSDVKPAFVAAVDYPRGGCKDYMAGSLKGLFNERDYATAVSLHVASVVPRII